jgi:hypothetical protein
LFITGKTPGNARSTGLAWVLGSAPNCNRRTAEYLGVCFELRVRLKTNNDFPLHNHSLFRCAGAGATHIILPARRSGTPLIPVRVDASQ